MLSFVNLIIPPILCLYILAKRGTITVEKNLELAGQYAAAVCANLVVTYGLLHLIQLGTGFYSFPDAQGYSLIAVVTAIVNAYVYEILKKYFRVSIRIDKKDEKE